MKFLLIIIVSLSSIAVTAQDKKVVVTVDDLPVVYYAKEDISHLNQITEDLIGIFKTYNIPAIGYINEGKLYSDGLPDESKVNLAKLWLSNGYELGNHTFSHMNYHTSSFEAFAEDVLKGDIITKELAQEYEMEVRFFRHPFLRSGKTKSQSDSLTQFLTKNGYVEAPVTIATEDYLFAKAYHIAYLKNDSELMEKVGAAYLDHMEQKIIYFERVSNDLFNRQIAQTLLIHANLLNSQYLDDVADIYIKHGYSFVTQEEVLKDKALKEVAV